MNFFDSSIINYLNKFAQTSPSFDYLMVSIVDNSFVKGVVLVCILCFFWFQNTEEQIRNREGVIICVFSCFVAIAVGRFLSLSLPFRARPIINPSVHFLKPFGTQALSLGTWSSFPSDNAVMFFSLATGIYLISRKVGLLAYLYVILVICFPRIYLGYHFPTDILVGALIGIIITWVISHNRIRKSLTKTVLNFSTRNSGLFYTLSFLMIYEISRMFIEIRVGCSHFFEFIHKVF